MENFPFYILVILVSLFFAGAFFSGVETALIAMSRHRLTELSKERKSISAAIQSWLENPNRLLTTMLIGINVVAISSEWVMSKMMRVLFEMYHYQPAAWVEPAISIGVVAVVFIMFGEIIPKILAIHNPEYYTVLLIKPLILIDRLLSPFTKVMVGISSLLIRAFGGKPVRHGPFVTEAEILGMVSMGEEQGVIDRDEREMIHGIIEFGDTIVREVMVPRPDMACAPKNLTVGQAACFIEEVGHSRIPIYEKTLENIVGIINSKDLIRAMSAGNKEEPITSIMRKPHFVPGLKKLDEMLREFREKQIHMAIVVNEHGVTSGLVTLEDLLEEIVGEIQDEYDTEEPLYRWLEENVLLVDGRMDMDELNDALGSEFPEEQDYDTLGGFIFSELGKVPREGDSVIFGNFELTVQSMVKRRIHKVTIKKMPAEPDEAESPDGQENGARKNGLQ
ncbi:MAG: hemolysin family protein [bacterium]